MAEHNISILYFDGKGRAEGARLILAAAGKKYEDVRFSEEEWPKYKPLAPFGQCPLLKVDGKYYAQSPAIKAYLAREFGFHGKTNLESLAIDQIVNLVEDYTTVCVGAIFTESEPEKSKAKEKNAEAAPKFKDNLEKLLKDSKSGYFVGDRLTLADIVVFDVFTGMCSSGVSIDDGHPLLKKNIGLVRSNKNIAAYEASRKVTPW